MNENEEKLVEVLAKVLTMRGIPKVKHNSYISNLLSITMSAGYKKITGATKWEVLQLKKVVESLGISMSDFFDVFDADAKEIQHGIWKEGGNEHKCKIYLAPENSGITTNISAIKVGDKWNVVPFTELNKDLLAESRRAIESLVIYPKEVQPAKFRLALLDDDHLVTESLKKLLKNDDYQIDTFDSITDLEDNIDRLPYDAYVLDWIVGDRSCLELIRKIRESSRGDAMIIVLTGKLAGINDEEISTAIHDYDIVGPYEKPLRAGVIKSNIDKVFSR